MEAIGDAHSFLSAARAVALDKPIIVIKAGRTEAAAKAAASHTGSLTGSDEVLDAAFHRCGVLRVERISQLFAMAEVLAKQPRPRGPRLTVVTNAGGPGVMVADALATEGGQLTELTPGLVEALNQFLPRHWSHANPIDIIGDADPLRYEKTLELVINDPKTDGLLVILCPQGMIDPAQAAERLTRFRQVRSKPILASWVGGASIRAGEAILNNAGIPTFAYPDTAARVFSDMWHYTKNLQDLYERPALPGEMHPDRGRAAAVIDAARHQGRTMLTELESKQILAAYGIPTVETRLAQSVAEATSSSTLRPLPTRRMWAGSN
jgi:acetyltransferase